MATTSQRAQIFLAKNQTNKPLPLAKCPTTKEILTLLRDLQKFMLIAQLLMLDMKKNVCVTMVCRSTDGNSQCVIKYNSTLFLTISYLGP